LSRCLEVLEAAGTDRCCPFAGERFSGEAGEGVEERLEVRLADERACGSRYACSSAATDGASIGQSDPVHPHAVRALGTGR
jgi:hypothetical protein